ncbi:carbamoyltransferase HypF [Actinoallomurus rhizosphaericola]|uniref:carbamoyltransferase HypF n=1 Tax=Actinoallomurus rhizosphaericola TaxID=2952536 RepID=UPI0020930A37|nr:carbamoyltransferase HypF [Actinoallomurus rhizosphaericola]MCO5995335.1 carbamoyltransferase HypF [Actinoallomurus rhizosphaericola]
MRIRTGIRVEGIVQGVGFRPFVHGLAMTLGLAGLVRNDASGVFIEVEGDDAAVQRFLRELRAPPPLAVIERITTRPLPAEGGGGFAIVGSGTGGRRTALVSSDSATCSDCLRELRDPADRRHGYAFVNCTACGPRFTIVTDVPYDRPNTTMAPFAMCADCAAEYHDPADRRFHAQPVCCPACGPRLVLRDRDGRERPGDPIGEARRLLRRGGTLAVKGLGGYHLAATAADEAAVAALRARKHREDKPFAVMAPDLPSVRLLADLEPAEEALLTSAARPIVLLRRKAGAPLAEAVAPGDRSIGVMLPYTPLHHLLVSEPLVLTSGNLSDEPIAHRDGDASARLRDIADAFLTHDRPIHVRTDDSVVRVFRGRRLPVRRSRGYVPRPLRVPAGGPAVLACGAELKNTFCLAEGGRAFVSHHIGDLENYETFRAFREGVEHFERLFGIAPAVLAHDPHPEYLSTKYALERAEERELPLVGVQHHHAHVAACLADNEHTGPVIGVAFDGTGLGTDGTLWGGEFLLADLTGFRRVGHLRPVPLPGGATAIREPWRMAAAYGVPDHLDVARRNAAAWDRVVAVGRAGLGAPPTSSMGRLFDAVAAVLGVRDRITYEGQAAVELEQRADPRERSAYPVRLEDAEDGGPSFVVPGAELLQAVVEDLLAGTPTPVIAARFHNAVGDLVVAGAVRLREATGLTTAALSGGVFQNLLVLERAVAGLEAEGLTVLVHHRVPPNDGGISLGQAAVALARTVAKPAG